ncbi:MAG: hypothetical protein C4341_01520 [Armatimonadota bacterium]
MTVGDKKKAIALGAVAVVVVGVAAVRIIPHGGRVAPTGVEVGEGADAGTSGKAEGSEVVGLLTAPFSHPMLARRESAENVSAESGSASKGEGSLGGGNYVPGPLVFLPEGRGESSQESEQAPRAEIVVRLQAIVHAGGRVAILEIGGRTIRALQGTEVTEGWKVIELSSSDVTLKGANGERRLRVGESLSLIAALGSERQKEG